MWLFLAKAIGYSFWIIFICFVLWAIFGNNGKAPKSSNSSSKTAKDSFSVHVVIPPGLTSEQIRAIYRDSKDLSGCWVCGRQNKAESTLDRKMPCPDCQHRFKRLLSSGNYTLPDGIEEYTFNLWGNQMVIAAQLNEGKIDKEEAHRRMQQVINEEIARQTEHKRLNSRLSKERQNAELALNDAERTMKNLMS